MDKHHRKYNTNTGVENFILRLKDNNPTLEYYSDYIDSESKVKLRCTVCGNIFERWASCVRTPGKIMCDCEKIEVRKRRELERQIEEQEKARQNKLKEQERQRQRELNNFLNSFKEQLSISICEYCGNYFVGNGKKKYCSTRCAERKHENIKSRKRLERASYNGKIDYSITLPKLIKRDNNICYLCGKECNSNDYTYKENIFIAGNYYPSVDHIKPIAKGGKHSWDNVKLAHRLCNSYKRDIY